MIDLTLADPVLAQTAPNDPGTKWEKEPDWAIDAPPDDQAAPAPEARWPAGAPRTGVCGAVTPRIVGLEGGYRMYYTQILPRRGFPAGANDYDHSTTRILSAFSPDGRSWTPEPGVRLSAEEGGAGDYRVVSADVVPARPGGARLRMFYECCLGPQSTPSTIRSAVSEDGGLTWSAETRTRLGAGGRSFVSPRILWLEDGRCRLYVSERGRGIISAISTDGGLTFAEEPGLRIGRSGPEDGHPPFASETFRIAGGGYRMYYAHYSAASRAAIWTALSEDGLRWEKHPAPVISPGGRWDAAKCSEMGLLVGRRAGAAASFRLCYEACDGTAPGARGVWRIAAATSGTRS